MNAKKNKIVGSLLLGRLIHVVAPEAGKPPKFQAVGDAEARVLTLPCTQQIYNAVLGTKDPGSTKFDLGLRKLTRVKFRALQTADKTVVGFDIIPNRMFVSGVAPAAAGRARKSGFEIRWSEACGGYDVYTEDPDTGESQRIAYAGMSETMLCELLDALRDRTCDGKKIFTVLGHKVEVKDDDVMLVRPVKAVAYTT